MSKSTFKFSNDSIEELRKLQLQFAEERNWDQFHTPRNLLLALVGEVGELAEIFHNKRNITDVSNWNTEEKEHLGEELSDVLFNLIRLSEKCCIDLPAVTLKRITQVNKIDSLTKQSFDCMLNNNDIENGEQNGHMKQLFKFSEIAFEVIRVQVQFLNDHSVRPYCFQNIVLTIVKEVGELAELFQWKGEVEVGIQSWNEKEKNNLEQELADVFINLVYLSHKCGIDLPVSAKNKLLKNSKKYPIKLVYGSCKKYTEYKEEKGKLVVT